MAKFKSVAQEAIEVLMLSENPKTAREIDDDLGNKYGSDNIYWSLSYWVKKGVVSSQFKEGSRKTKEYSYIG